MFKSTSLGSADNAPSRGSNVKRARKFTAWRLKGTGRPGSLVRSQPALEQLSTRSQWCAAARRSGCMHPALPDERQRFAQLSTSAIEKRCRSRQVAAMRQQDRQLDAAVRPSQSLARLIPRAAG